MHEAGREHFGVHPKVAAWAFGQHLRNLVRDASYACLKRAAVVHVVGRILRYRHLDISWRLIQDHERVAFGVDQDIDFVDMQTMRVVGFDAICAGKLWADLNEQDPIRICSRGVEFIDTCAGMKAEADPSFYRRGSGHCHHARRQMVQHRGETAKVRRDVIDRCPAIA